VRQLIEPRALTKTEITKHRHAGAELRSELLDEIRRWNRRKLVQSRFRERWPAYKADFAKRFNVFDDCLAPLHLVQPGCGVG